MFGDTYAHTNIMIDLTSFVVPSYDRYGNLTDFKFIRDKEISS